MQSNRQLKDEIAKVWDYGAADYMDVEILRHIADDNLAVREKAIQELLLEGAERAAETLFQVFVMAFSGQADIDEKTDYISDKLQELGRPAFNILTTALNSVETDNVQAAAYLLGRMRQDEAIGYLLKALENKNSKVQSSVALALSNFNDTRIIEPLLKAFKRNSTHGAAAALVKLGIVAPVIEALGSNDPQIRYNATRALALYGDNHTIEVLNEFEKIHNLDYVSKDVAIITKTILERI